MKAALLYFLILELSLVSSPTNGQKINKRVILHGTVKNFTNIVEVKDNGDTEPFQITNTVKSFLPDSEGQFAIEFALNRPKYFRIARNLVYLSPGDNLEIDLDYTNAANSTFKGRHSQENIYLKHTPYPKAGSFLQAGINVKSTVNQTVKQILELANQRSQSLHSYKNLAYEFKWLEDKRIDTDILNSLYSIGTYFPYAHKLRGDSLTTFEKDFFNSIDSFARKHVSIRLDPRLLNLEVYRDMLPIILKLTSTVSKKDSLQVNDWLLAKKVVHEMQTTNEPSDIFVIEGKINQIKTLKYRNEVYTAYKKLLSYTGNNATDILFMDPQKNSIKLSSFRGKIIYIDVWATWCAPCIKEQPYLDSLRERYKDNSNIVFLSLSIDTDIVSWIKYVNKMKSSNFQYVLNLSALKSYYVSEVPRTIVIDKNFRVYSMRGPMPSNPETINIIQKMLQEK